MGGDVAGAGGLSCDSVCMLVFLCGVVVVMSCPFFPPICFVFNQNA